KVTRAEDAGGASEEDEDLLRTIKSMHEQNPMLGLRGVRLGLMIPDFVKVQTRAILNAQIKVKQAGGNPIAKIMIPLVGHVNELARTRELLDAEAKAVESKAGVSVDYKFGTMIEVPRGALTADEIAREASFFSFGTNDLTQMTFGYSRDDAEGGFLLKYVEDKILPVNPFQTLDDAVAGLMKIAVEKGRATRPGLEIGICGEHGGDPESIAKCEKIGLDYVSCSPFRVPVARLAAGFAQGVISLDFMSNPEYDRFATLSSETFDQASARTGVPLPLLGVIREAIGLGSANGHDLLRDDELAVVPFIEAQLAAGFR